MPGCTRECVLGVPFSGWNLTGRAGVRTYVTSSQYYGDFNSNLMLPVAPIFGEYVYLRGESMETPLGFFREYIRVFHIVL
jgi:hypothetical protein